MRPHPVIQTRVLSFTRSENLISRIKRENSKQLQLSYVRPNGYTLTEILITLGMIALVGMLGGGWLATQIPRYSLSGAARQVRSDFLAARMQAVSEGNKYRITFLDDRRYTILDDDNNNGRADPGERVESRDIQAEYPAVTLSSTNNPIFHPRGTASNLATVTVTNEAGSRTVKVSITGRVKISS